MAIRLTAQDLESLRLPPGERPPPRRRNAAPEADLLRSCLRLLAHRGVRHHRLNSGSVVSRGRRVRLAPAGTPDVLAYLPAGGATRVLALELKSPRGRLSAAQRAWRDAWAPAGVVYCVVRSLDDLLGILEAHK